MTDSPNLALAEEIELTIRRVEKLRSMLGERTVTLTNAEYDRIIAALRAQPSGDWVPVSERLPEAGEYLVLVSGKYIKIGEFYISSTLPSGIWNWGYVSHWMPLPQTASALRSEGAGPMSDHYILEGKTPIACDLMTWTKWYKAGCDNRRVASTKKNGIYVSTVFLGLYHQYGDGPPLLFETMIFGGKHDEYQERCSTWDEAEKMHAAACKLAFGAAHE